MRKFLAIVAVASLCLSSAKAFEMPRVTAYCLGDSNGHTTTLQQEWMTCENWTHCDDIGGIVVIEDGWAEFFVAPSLHHIWDLDIGYPPHLSYPIQEYARFGTELAGRIGIEMEPDGLESHMPCFNLMGEMPVVWPLTLAQNLDPEEVGTSIGMRVDGITLHIWPTGRIKRVVMLFRETWWSTIRREIRGNVWGAGIGLVAGLAVTFIMWLLRKARKQ